MEPRLERDMWHAGPLGVVLSLLVRPLADERTRRTRARGERPAGLIIGRLPGGWHASEHRSHVDHIVVGPSGAFVLSAKDLTGKVWLGARSVRHNGHPTDFVSDAAREATHASRSLAAAVGRPVDVRGVLAILADEWTIVEEPSDVHVGSPRSVKDWLLRLPVTLSAHDVVEIAAAAADPSTWSTRKSPARGRTVSGRSAP